MPITPLHFGPGFLIKAIAPRHFSWCSFAGANVLIDLEPAIYWLLDGEPHHRFFHTLPGATITAIVSALIAFWLLGPCLRWWNRQLSPQQARWLGADAEVAPAAIWIGALIGGWSHVILDSFMHYDIRPLSPITDTNVLIAMLSIDSLYSLCFGAGAVGAAILFALRFNKNSKR